MFWYIVYVRSGMRSANRNHVLPANAPVDQRSQNGQNPARNGDLEREPKAEKTMKLRMLKTRQDETKEEPIRGRRGPLHVVEGSTQIIEWPFPAAQGLPQGGVEVKAEVQAKRFHDRGVDAERYTATLRATDNSPY